MLRATLLLAAALLLAGCTEEPATTGPHTHAGGGHVSLPVGDGTRATEVGYSLTDVELPDRALTRGEVTFTVETFRGRPLTDYVEEQTKDLHLYLVRDDLSVFRHLHPVMDREGRWSAPVSLPAAGDYRVVVELVARDPGGNGDHVVLGETVSVVGGPTEPAASDPVLQVDVTGSPVVGDDGRLGLRIRDDHDRAVRLGSYLGTFGHVTGFHRTSGAAIHLHPLGVPQPTEEGTVLSFHTDIEQSGDYLIFVQVRVDGFLHTVPVQVVVSSGA